MCVVRLLVLLAENLFRNALGHFFVVVELHGIVAAALRTGAQVRCIAKHFGKRHHRVDALGAGAVLHAFIMGSSRTGLADLRASLSAMEPAILKAISEESTSW